MYSIQSFKEKYAWQYFQNKAVRGNVQKCAAPVKSPRVRRFARRFSCSNLKDSSLLYRQRAVGSLQKLSARKKSFTDFTCAVLPGV
eukprot:s130_g38.t1